MSLSTILDVATHALGINQQALRTTSVNISNVNTPGYVRQRVDLQASVVGQQGNGVEIAGIQRMVDKFLQAASWTATADASKYSTMADYYDRFDSLLGDPNNNTSVTGKLDALFSSLSTLAVDPTAAGNRQSSLSSIASFGDTVSQLSSQIQSLRGTVSGEVGDEVNQINAALKRIYDLNPQIVASKTGGNDAASLEEQRDEALSDLSKMMDIQVNTNADGSVQVSTSTGVALVDIRLQQLQYDPPGTITSGTLFPPITLHAVDQKTGIPSPAGTPLDAGVTSGELRGLLDMRDKALPDFATELGNLAANTIDALNAAHNANVAYPPPHDLTGVTTGMLGSDRQGFTGKASFAVLDGSGNLVNKADIDFDSYPPGTTLDDVIADVNAQLGGDATLSLTNGVMQFTAAAPGNGVAIAQDPTVPSDRGGHGFSQFFGMNNLMQSAVPSNFDTGVAGTDASGFAPGGTLNLQLRGPNGEANLSYTLTTTGGTFDDVVNDLNASPLSAFMSFSLDGNGKLNVTPTPGYQDYKLFSVSDSTSRGATGVTLSQFFGIGQSYAANAANGVALAKPIANDSQRFALARFDPSAGVGEPAVTVGDGRGASALAGIANQTISFGKAGQVNAMQATLGQYGAAFLSSAALAGSSNADRKDDAAALSSDISEKLSNKSGVNMDEELSNLLIYQNAYSASARIVTTVQDMMDSLLNMMR
jgi:flagellar hook-associated protein 1 FlgK